MKKKILITGANGMLACEFRNMFQDHYDLLLTDYKELDITDMKEVKTYVSKNTPDIILNCAAYTAVDNAEDIGMKKNYDVNTLGVYNLAKISSQYNADFITFSSDYVFGGDSDDGYKEYDKKAPLNAYGMAKYLGEELSIKERKDTIIVRTSWLYGGGKQYKNFVNTMLDVGTKLDNLKVIDDQLGNPTYAKDLSEAVGEVIENIGKYRGKIFHLSNTTSGKGISWYDFATEIFKIQDISVECTPCGSSAFPTKAKRPHFSKLLNTSDITLRDWREGLKDYLYSLR